MLWDLVGEGLIGHVGASNFDAGQLRAVGQPGFHRRGRYAATCGWSTNFVASRRSGGPRSGNSRWRGGLAYQALQVAIVRRQADLEETAGALDIVPSQDDLAQIDKIMSEAVPLGAPAPEGA
nr:hypothetical protein [Actinomadura montaniterrae]